MVIFCHDFCPAWIYFCNVMIMKEWTSRFFLIKWKLNESINKKKREVIMKTLVETLELTLFLLYPAFVAIVIIIAIF